MNLTELSEKELEYILRIVEKDVDRNKEYIKKYIGRASFLIEGRKDDNLLGELVKVKINNKLGKYDFQ